MCVTIGERAKVFALLENNKQRREGCGMLVLQTCRQMDFDDRCCYLTCKAGPTAELRLMLCLSISRLAKSIKGISAGGLQIRLGDCCIPRLPLFLKKSRIC